MKNWCFFLETRSNSRLPSPDSESWCGRDLKKRDHLLPAVKPSSLVVYVVWCSSQTDLVHLGNSKNSNGFLHPWRGPGSCSQTASWRKVSFCLWIQRRCDQIWDPWNVHFISSTTGNHPGFGNTVGYARIFAYFTVESPMHPSAARYTEMTSSQYTDHTFCSHFQQRSCSYQSCWRSN